jgi:cell division protease FtsH
MLEPVEHVHQTKSYLMEQIAVMLGGRAAENLVFKEMTTGASDDINKATEVARAMVEEFGMSDLGPINFSPDFASRRNPYESVQISPDTSSKVDAEVKKITDIGYKNAQVILAKVRKKLDLLAEELLIKETLESEEFEKLIGSRKIALARIPTKG